MDNCKNENYSIEETSKNPPMTENEYLAMTLRLMMDKANGEDKCNLCKAAEALEKERPSNNFSWWLIILFAIFMFNGASPSFCDDSTFLTAFTEAMSKMNKTSEVQNESSEMHSDE